MKFSELEKDNWEKLRPYLDTALLPLSGLNGSEAPHEATEALERLRDALEPLETAYRGRVVTYPALHYAEDDQQLARLADKLCARLKESGFKHCIVVAGRSDLLDLDIPNASALIGPDPRDFNAEDPAEAYRARAARMIESLWNVRPSGS